ncbi:hypothetical protein [Microbulbifer variabilis]|uniref:hypothetical protein n=1 Tax=Microbulbifer variabilis TaxID=266805 RepID=UPI0003822C0A|nr:hypothetical protein [Microbulbifer variabilis]
MKKLFSILMLSSISGVTFAECAGGQCVAVDIDKLYVTTGNITYVGTSGDEKLLNCSAEAGVYTTLDKNQVGADAIYATLLAAQMAGKKINIRIVDGSQSCSIQYVTLERQ